MAAASLLVATTATVGTTAHAPPPAEAGEASRSQAPEPSIRVTPATGLVHGQVIEVEVTGLSGEIYIAQCDPENVASNSVHCRRQVVSSPDGGAITVPFTVEEEYDTFYRGTFHHTSCGGVDDDCLMVAFTADVPADSNLTTPIHFGPPRPDPAVVVTPSSGLRHGDPVQVEVVGLGFADHLDVLQCERDVAAALLDDPVLIYACRRLGTHSGEPSDRFVVSGTIAEAWTWDGLEGVEAAHCGPEPGGCVIIAYGIEDDLVMASPIDVEPSPLALAPGDQEVGSPVHVFVSGRPGAQVRIAQCATPVRRTARASRCGPAQSLTLDETGDGAATLTVLGRITTRHRTIRCTDGRCAVAAFTTRGVRLATVPLVVYPPDAPPEVSVDPDVDLVDQQGVGVTVTGTRNATVRVAQCDASVVDAGHLDETRCGSILTVTTGHESPQLDLPLSATRLLATGDGSTVECGNEPGDCVFAAEVDPGGFASAPISFAPP